MLFLGFEQVYTFEEELLLLLEEYTSKNPGFSYNEYDPFDFDSIQRIPRELFPIKLKGLACFLKGQHTLVAITT